MNRFHFQIFFALGVLLAVLLSVAGLILGILFGEWLTVFAVLAGVLIFFAVIARIAVHHFTNPLIETEMMIRQLIKGNYKMRTYVYGPESIGRVNHLLNDLAEHLQDTKRTYRSQQDQLETLIENIGSSFVFIDVDGRVRLANRMFQKTFRLKKNEWFRKAYSDVLPYEDTVDLIKQVVVEERAIRKTMVLPIGIKRRHFEVYCAPILHGYRRSEGTVVVLHEITELKKLEQMRKDFVANVSHELKTPVTSLKGFSETLLEEETAGDEAVRRKFLTIIRKESERLEALISDLLELSRIENEKFRLDWQRTNVGEVINETLLVLKEKAAGKEISLAFSDSGENVMVEADPARLKQIFLNVVDNAIAYSPQDSSVSIRMEERLNKVEITVEDQGIGMDPEEIPRVFERFYRIDKARSRGSGGTGLGLAIVKHLTEAHGGRIEVESLIGKGTKFKIILKK
ncbi:MAG TPA: ATP-binding protein [Bacillales bacterium]|nr:ATP-binding protein [Bacillales bacterium]